MTESSPAPRLAAVPPLAPARSPEVHPRRPIKEMEVMVADVKVETHDTVTLILFTGNDHLEYKAGHFLTIDPHQFEALDRFIDYFEDVKGEREPTRAYSMSSAPHERYLAVTVKEERYVRGVTKYPPLLSPLLVKRTNRGMRLSITGFSGPYVLPDDVSQRTDHLVHVVAGSGAVPNFAMVKWAIAHCPSIFHTWICSNKTWQDVIFREELAELERQNPSRLRVLNLLTRDPVTPATQGTWKGRLNAGTIRDLVPDPRAALVYACGPANGPNEVAAARAKGAEPAPRFLESAVAALREAGFADDRIQIESYG